MKHAAESQAPIKSRAKADKGLAAERTELTGSPNSSLMRSRSSGDKYSSVKPRYLEQGLKERLAKAEIKRKPRLVGFLENEGKMFG